VSSSWSTKARFDRLGTDSKLAVKCLDCPGKLYTPGPEKGVNNFEVHLKNKMHREKVEARIAGGG